MRSWTSEDGAYSVIIEGICGAVRVVVWHHHQANACPNVFACVWDTPPDDRLTEILNRVFAALGELPDFTKELQVKMRLYILMFEWYGDIFDGVKARPIDRYHPDYNPHANPWWKDAQELRAKLSAGVHRHHIFLDLDRPPLGVTNTIPVVDDLVLQVEAAFDIIGSDPEVDRDNLLPPGIEIGWYEWLEQAWSSPGRDPQRPNPPGWAGIHMPSNG